MSNGPVTLADVRAHIEQRIAELNPNDNGPDTRLMDPNGLADMLSERAVHKELTEILVMLNQAQPPTEQETEKSQEPDTHAADNERRMLIAAASEAVIEGNSLHAAIREHRLAMTSDARQSAHELLQHLEKAASDLLTLLRQEESYVQSNKINSRTLVYDYLLLPFSLRRSVMSCLGFPGAEDYVTPEKDLHHRFFGWARENKLIDRLQDEIGKAKP